MKTAPRLFLSISLAAGLALATGCGDGTKTEEKLDTAAFLQALGENDFGAAGREAAKIPVDRVDDLELLGHMINSLGYTRDVVPLTQALERAVVRFGEGLSDEDRSRYWTTLATAAGFEPGIKPFMRALHANLGLGEAQITAILRFARTCRVAGRGAEAADALRTLAGASESEVGAFFERIAKESEVRSASERGESEPQENDPLDLRLRRALAAGPLSPAEVVRWSENRKLEPISRLLLLRSVGRYDEALALVDLLPVEQWGADNLRGHRLRIFREAGRRDDAIRLINTSLDGDPTLSPWTRAFLTNAKIRVLLESQRWDEALALARAALDDNSVAIMTAVELSLWAGVAALLAGEDRTARKWIENAAETFPLHNPQEFNAWIRARFLIVPKDSEGPIAAEWTRSPQFLDNDLAYLRGLKALLEGRPEEAREHLRNAHDLSVGDEFPKHLATAALAAPALSKDERR